MHQKSQVGIVSLRASTKSDVDTGLCLLHAQPRLTSEDTFDLCLPQSSGLFLVDAVALPRLKRAQQHVPRKAERPVKEPDFGARPTTHHLKPDEPTRSTTTPCHRTKLL